MTNSEIVRLFFRRDEAALAETQKAYGRYCHAVAFNLLGSEQDAEECVNDALLAAWNSIPPQDPDNLAAYLGKLTRCIAIDKLRTMTRDKRGGGVTSLCLDELEECLPDTSVEETVAEEALSALIDRWLRRQNATLRCLFIGRYWHCEPLKSLAKRCGISEGNAKTLLHRGRLDLKSFLQKEGVL